MASGVDLAKIDGIKNIGEQAKNIAESDAYVDVRYGKGPIAARVMGKVPIHAPTQYKVGAGVAVSPTKHISIGATYIHEQVVKDKIDSLRVGAEIQPTKDLIVGAYVSTPIMGDNQKNLAVGGGVTWKFN